MATHTSSLQSVFSILIHDYSNYNQWVNSTLINWLKTKNLQLMDKEVPSSFSSVKKTLLHIWQTEHFWFKKLQQKEGNEIAGPSLDTTEVFKGILQHSIKMTDYITTLDDNMLTEKVKINTPWFSSNQPRYELIQHCFNHSTYHRGQIITMGRNLGWTDAPMTDFNFYLLMVKAQA
jgi:uncharacterized damage-inducible protein DinB